jgi:hypothetical protein
MRYRTPPEPETIDRPPLTLAVQSTTIPER